MILTCPECGARYRLADDAIPPAGRTVQCASCKHSWFEPAPVAPAPATQAPPAAVAAPAPTPAYEAIPRPAPAPATDTPRSSHWLWTAAALVAALVLSVLAASVWKLDLGALGIPLAASTERQAAKNATTSPLLITATVQLRVLESGGNFMAVNGTITNPTKTGQPVVAMVADLLDAQGKVIDSWTIPAPLAVLPAGRSVSFDSAASNVKPGAASLSVHFPGVAATQ